MVLPTFIICGTQKGGTTSLFHHLKEHPEICLSKHKEVHYFDLNYCNSIEWYEEHFKNCKNKEIKAIGEASPFYMHLEEVPERIKKILPNIKLIFILRNPVDRTYSNYWHEVKIGYESLSFEEAIRKEEERLSEGDIFNKRHYAYKDRSKYIIQLKRYRKYFPQKQMLILMNEDLKENREKAIRRLFGFLEIDTNFTGKNWGIIPNPGKRPRIQKLQKLRTKLPDNSMGWMCKYAIDKINLKEGYPPMKQHTREKLLEYFKPYTNELEEFLGRKLDGWYK